MRRYYYLTRKFMTIKPVFSIDPNWKNWVYCVGVQTGTVDQWNTVWDKMQIASNSLGMDIKNSYVKSM